MSRGCKLDINSLPLKYQRQAFSQIADGKKSRNRVADTRTVKKQGRPDALGKKAEIPRFHTPCTVSVHVWKCGDNWDADNIETKAIIDSLVKNGVLTDDTIKEVPEVRKRGFRCKTRKEQKTIVIIEENNESKRSITLHRTM